MNRTANAQTVARKTYELCERIMRQQRHGTRPAHSTPRDAEIVLGAAQKWFPRMYAHLQELDASARMSEEYEQSWARIDKVLAALAS